MRFALAWGDPENITFSSIPITPEDLAVGLTARRCLALLALRVEWLIEQAVDPREAMAELAEEMERAGLWNGPRRFEAPWIAVQDMLIDNPV